VCFSCKFRGQGLSNQRGICHGLTHFGWKQQKAIAKTAKFRVRPQSRSGAKIGPRECQKDPGWVKTGPKGQNWLLGGQIGCPSTILFKSAKLGFLQATGRLSPNNSSKRMLFWCKFHARGWLNQRGICQGLSYFVVKWQKTIAKSQKSFRVIQKGDLEPKWSLEGV